MLVVMIWLYSRKGFLSHKPNSRANFKLNVGKLPLPWASAEIFPGAGKVDILLVLFRLLTIQCKSNGRSDNALPLLHHKENDPHVTATVPKNALRWQQCFFSHRIKLARQLKTTYRC